MEKIERDVKRIHSHKERTFTHSLSGQSFRARVNVLDKPAFRGRVHLTQP